MTRDQFNDFDSFLAAAEVTGTRFGVMYLPVCAVGSWAITRGMEVQAREYRYTEIAEHIGLPLSDPDGPSVDDITLANDRSEGDPRVVRAELHRLFPEYVEPSRSSLGEPALNPVVSR